MPKSREIFTQGMMTNGKAKNHFIISWGAMDVDMFGKLKAAFTNGQLAQRSRFQGCQANPASVGISSQHRPGPGS